MKKSASSRQRPFADVAREGISHDLGARRKPANLTINEDLLRQARALKINLSATLEDALVKELHRRWRARWLEDNRDAIAAYNADVERQGTYSDGVRTF